MSRFIDRQRDLADLDLVQPNLDMLELGLLDELWEIVNSQIRAFIGQYAFEDLCREWVLVQARAGDLPFRPQRVGGHWAADMSSSPAPASPTPPTGRPLPTMHCWWT